MKLINTVNRDHFAACATHARTHGIEATRKIGNKALQSELLSSVDVATTAAVKSTYVSYKGIEGTTVTVSDAHGNDFPNVKILNGEFIRARAVSTAVGGQNANPAAVLDCRWSVLTL